MTAPEPALPSFVNGTVPTANDLNALSDNISGLFDRLQAGFRVRRPIVALRITRENHELVSGTDRQIIWDLADVDTDNMWSGVTSEQIVFNTPGLYLIGFQPTLVASGAAAGAVLAARILFGNAAFAGDWTIGNALAVDYGPVQAGTGAAAFASTLVAPAAGDRVRFMATQNSGAAVALDPGFGGTKAFAVWLAPR